jgi:predicted acylesterase/phospholipase RssA/CRP-like cAMP-binding protein
MTDIAGLARSLMFTGLADAELALIADRARAQTFEPGEHLCTAGEPSTGCWVITGGLVDVVGASGGVREGEVLARRRKGGTVGEVGVILGAPQTETVVASIRTTALELRAADVDELVQRYPRILINVLGQLNERATYVHERSAERELGETVALVAGPSLRAALPSLIAAARRASPRSVIGLDRQFSFAGAVTAADDLATAHATVVLPSDLEAESVEVLLRESDRVVALAATAHDAAELGRMRRPPGTEEVVVEVVLASDDAHAASLSWPADAPLRVVRTCEVGEDRRLAGDDVAWIARHLTRTKIGLALGAGGAKGYAHIGALQVLEDAGYVVDCVAGSSIGAVIGTLLALGESAAEIDATLRRVFDEAAVAEIFKVSLSGKSTGLELMTRLLREITSEHTFDEVQIPLTIMSVDLDERAPAPLRTGPLWQALLAGTALAGMFPPHERDGHRLVDGLALVPVPTGAVVESGADVTISINLIGRETLPSWPDGPAAEPPEVRRRRGVLDNLLEVMDLSQMAESVRHAELADVAITPRFGPGEWRDFHLADRYLAAGREAALTALPRLRSLALPAITETPSNPEGEGIDRADAIRV